MCYSIGLLFEYEYNHPIHNEDFAAIWDRFNIPYYQIFHKINLITPTVAVATGLEAHNMANKVPLGEFNITESILQEPNFLEAEVNEKQSNV